MLLSILTLYNFYFIYKGVYTFQMSLLLNPTFISTHVPPFWRGLHAFRVPALLPCEVALIPPLHSWLPDAYETAPYPGTVILAGALSLMGGFGLFGILLPIAQVFPAPLLGFLIFLGIVSLVYFSLVAMMQRNLKRMMAYASAGAMGFVTISFAAGILENGYDMNLELAGGMFQIVAHGLIMAAVFTSLYYISEFTGHERIPSLGGLYREAPLASSMLLAALMASLGGLPGFAGFIGEFSIVVASFQVISWAIMLVIFA